MLSPYNLLLIKHITFIQERNISRENMSFVCSNRFIKSIEPHVKLVTLQLLWWRQPGCCSCDVMIDYKTQSTSLSLQHHSFFSFSKINFWITSKNKINHVLTKVFYCWVPRTISSVINFALYTHRFLGRAQKHTFSYPYVKTRVHHNTFITSATHITKSGKSQSI